MPSQTNEQALEACIERALVGSSREERDGERVQEESAQYRGREGYEVGKSSDFDLEFSIDTQKFWTFLEKTQPNELAKLNNNLQEKQALLERLNKKIKSDGTLSLLKKGLSNKGAHFTLFYSQPYNNINPELHQKFDSNCFSITRQLYYSKKNPSNSIDIVIFVNGLPLLTIELKNLWTGQNVNHAKKQYQDRRDSKELLLQFNRCLVHFAVDTEEVWMTTKLADSKTHFLPFNQGHRFGQGNPPNASGHRTAYLWQQILPRKNLSKIVEHFSTLIEEKDPEIKKTQKKLLFPRYHQWDVVNHLLGKVRRDGAGQAYLIQHSAGSGKSNSITWLAYQLIEVYETKAKKPVFDSIIVVTDRKLLDKQLRDNIKQFSRVKNIVSHADHSSELKAALEKGKKIIISTLQKFPHVAEGIDNLSEKKFAVVIDEAHSSQSGKSSDQLALTLASQNEETGEEDFQEKIVKIMEGRKLGRNASYFAFTATPKKSTLEKFGEKQENGKFTPAHLYSMKQAIEEGFILDVLANYTTYKSYYEIQKSVEENPSFNTKKAKKKLRAYVEGYKETIAVKAEVIVNHFVELVLKPKKLRGKAKAIVLTRNIEAAIRYYFAIKKSLAKRNNPFQILIAFSGKKEVDDAEYTQYTEVDGTEYTEKGLNGFPESKTAEEFKRSQYKILVVANKFLTGFDEPLLHSMYIDKKLQGVQAVQALSRLNRCNTKMKKQDTFVLDFFNLLEDIKTAFDPFYTSTTLAEATDPNVLHDLREALDDVGVYESQEVDEFNELYFSNAPVEQLDPKFNPAMEQFEKELELDDTQKIDFKIKAKQFVKVYAQLACILQFDNIELEKLHWYLKFLIPKLKVRNPDQDQIDDLLASVDLSSYGLERTHIQESIGLDEEESELSPQSPTVWGYQETTGDQSPLNQILEEFNRDHFDNWDTTPEEQRVIILQERKKKQ